MIVGLVPPFESVPREQQHRDKGVLWARLLQVTESGFSETDALNLNRHFWRNCEAYEVEESHYADIEKISLGELEHFCNSCLLRPFGCWISKDMAVRIPTAQLSCLSDDCLSCDNTEFPCCTQRDRWLDETQLVCHCLKLFNERSSSNEFYLSLDNPFPLNVKKRDNSAAGWLFHAGGRQAQILSRMITVQLIKANIHERKGTLYLFAVGENEELEEKELFPTPGTSVSDTDRGDQDILDLSHRPHITIYHMR